MNIYVWLYKHEFHDFYVDIYIPLHDSGGWFAPNVIVAF